LNITFIGGGNMAQAIIGGLAKKKFDRAGIAAVELLAATRERLSSESGVRCVATVAEAKPLGDLVVMAVKPQHMREAAKALSPHLSAEIVLSIAAGTRLADLGRWLGGHELLVRCMPNTPALIGAGITAAYAAPGVNEFQRRLAAQVLEAVGEVLWVEDESLLDPVTAVSGSGPAYVFYFIEALQEAAVSLGLGAEQARRLALQTFLGAAKLAAAGEESVSALRQRVTSKGGTTEAALESMVRDQVREAIVRAVHAASDRACALGDELGKD